MLREFRRREFSSLIAWTGSDGPMPAEVGVVGVEYRGRLGHPSSYGLLMARATDSPGVQLDLHPMPVALSVPCDEVTLGSTEPEYAEALRAAGRGLARGLVVTGIGEGLYGSSVVVFTRLVAVISLLLAMGLASADEVDVWASWDSAWPEPPHKA
ncbi:hypothetical protein GCE86_26065 [Micromonospora terminaliae]|uniref:Uncharacterized protein n=1 Tax=Micromonospora terminaliae TaxID=1914461 RepID=A0AAJ3DJL3_9ACTN|nr:hypothetical protein [Micromonospora terminaliae]NES25970.1 hypothetical protein [Micromonospora terminaliae]QGL50181.1 hypothetical protein GCE86_26065 [Micromonospora terminaliae]